MTHFGHETTASFDIKCIRLLQKVGPSGYGVFWILVEAAARYVSTLNPQETWGCVDPSFSTEDLAGLCYLSPEEFQNHLNVMDEIGLTQKKTVNGKQMLYIPNLKKHLSRYFADQMEPATIQMAAATIQMAAATSEQPRHAVHAVHASTAMHTNTKGGGAKTRPAPSINTNNPSNPTATNDPFTSEERSLLGTCDLSTEEGRLAHEDIMRKAHIRHNQAGVAQAERDRLFFEQAEGKHAQS